jgi:hypothetical protein
MLQQDELTLWSIDDIENAAMQALSATDQQTVSTILQWSKNFLLNTHPQLGRDGPVCPFTKPSMSKHLYFIAGPQHGRNFSEIQGNILRFQRWYASLITKLEESSRNFLTFLIPLPDFDRSDPAPLDELQARLKNDVVRQGLMIGQFHPECEQPGLWNNEFRPLKCVIPLLAIRVMVLYDLPFLMETQEHLDAYLATFASEIPPRVRGHLVSKLYAPRPEAMT